MILTLIALSWMTFDLRGDAPGGDAQDRVALTAIAPLQQVLSAVGQPAASAVRWIDDQRALHERLDALRDVERQLGSARAGNADLAAENHRLRRLLEMRERRGHRTVGAQVLGTPPGDPGGGLVITAGARQGVAPGMTVVDVGGLVGRIVAVSSSHARVELATSPQARYAVRVVPGDLSGRLQGAGGGRMIVELDDPRGAPPTGAMVVTRTFEGSAVPDGVAVGVVQDAPPRRRSLPVRPHVQASALRVVQVVVDARTQPSDVAGDAVPADAAALPRPPRPGER